MFILLKPFDIKRLFYTSEVYQFFLLDYTRPHSHTFPPHVGHGGLGITCSPRDPRSAGSNPSEVDGFFQDVKILSTSPPGGTLSWGSRV